MNEVIFFPNAEEGPSLLVRRCDAPGALWPFLERLGVSDKGKTIMAPKGDVLTVEIRHLNMPLAQILKQEALATGADFATPKNAILLEDKFTHGLLICTRARWPRLMEKMRQQPLGGKALAARLEKAFSVTAPPPQIMGVLNLTPDSFHDGGHYETEAAQTDRLQQMKEEGADWVDLGPMSTRPGALPVPPQEQIRRLSFALKKAVEVFGDRVSVDTPSGEVAEWALAQGAGMINDITGGADGALLQTVAAHHARLTLMHMQGNPQTMQQNPAYEDVTLEVGRFLEQQALRARWAGVAAENIWLDPGIGFGKSVAHNLALLKELPALAAMGYPVLVGLSRKSFLGAIGAGEAPQDRLEGSLVSAVFALAQGASVVRVHDVAATHKAILTAQALGFLAG